MDLYRLIRDIPDFPQKGVIFKDITPLLKDAEAFRETIDRLIERLQAVDFDYIVVPEARGFIFGSAIAYEMRKGFIPVRKPGKLPYQTRKVEFTLEYGKAGLEIHEDALLPGAKVVLLDDVLATGGTIKAIAGLIEGMGGTVAKMLFLIELTFLEARKVLETYSVDALMSY
ncbi:MAG TPA: adenine phosphoribosyltransferase [Thermotogota bacterium]|jgi:adenine phosphoribosyltransferase|nr:adenine phosphoribosyltransferase [Thermotogota bacterium]NLZ14182.1 adenine phosphoribosyltransferase [Thermotogaceae bacterium]HNR62614.1 adenine phosphoribosyltransferase [Thermotogota bacterium]HNT94620.1 adenine phosphoribosyltransferase [Thermotogota bacterium]HPB85978.1 adenine phosphoribosyltransferase [Thermotogota bacterium]